jgi:hypothetical protein
MSWNDVGSAREKDDIIGMSKSSPGSRLRSGFGAAKNRYDYEI